MLRDYILQVIYDMKILFTLETLQSRERLQVKKYFLARLNKPEANELIGLCYRLIRKLLAMHPQKL